VKITYVLVDKTSGLLDLCLAAEKDKDISWGLMLVDLHSHVSSRGYVISRMVLLRPYLGHRELTSRDVENCGAAEECRDGCGVHRGRHYDDAKGGVRGGGGGARGDQAFEEREEDVGVEGALMGLIEDYDRVPEQSGISQG
jgi:hypothetical protein